MAVCPDPITYHPIGIIRSMFVQPADTPVQAAGAAGAPGVIELLPQYRDALLDIEGFSHLILVYHFHRSAPARNVITPFLDHALHGVFATRAPARPNAIGLSTVRLQAMDDVRIRIPDVDILDGTPLLDIKPYLSAFDHRAHASSGWFAGKLGELEQRRGDDRFQLPVK